MMLGAIRKGDIMFFFDLKGAYFQIRILSDSLPYLQIILNKKVIQFKALCLGFSTAPRSCKKVFSLVLDWGPICSTVWTIVSHSKAEPSSPPSIVSSSFVFAKT